VTDVLVDSSEAGRLDVRRPMHLKRPEQRIPRHNAPRWIGQAFQQGKLGTGEVQVAAAIVSLAGLAVEHQVGRPPHADAPWHVGRL
jgi:hypothetical protein